MSSVIPLFSFFETLHTGAARRRLCWIILSLAGAFALALHPGSGVPGGILYLLVGWTVPSVFNLLASALILSFIPRPSWGNSLVSWLCLIAISFLLASAPALPLLAMRLAHPPAVTSIVRRPVVVHGHRLATYMVGPMDVIANPLTPIISWGSDEGCDCSYWVVTDRGPTSESGSSFVGLLTDDIDKVTGEAGFGWVLPNQPIIQVPGRAPEVPIVMVTADPKSARLIDVAVTVSDAGQVTAELHLSGFPRYPRALVALDRTKLLNGHFIAITWYDLTHGTFWSPLIGYQLGGYPRRYIQAFLRDAFVLKGS